jgi:copper homeostasis protein
VTTQRGPLLEVIVVDARDAAAAQDGGADRLEIVSSPERDGLTPSVAALRRIRAATDLPLRVMLRETDRFTASPRTAATLCDAAAALLAAGADGVVLGFLTEHGDLDEATLAAVLPTLGAAPWTFHRAVDHAADADAAWSRLRQLPRLDTVLTSGGPGPLAAGLAALTARVATDPFAATVTMAGGGLRPEQVPALRRAGVRAFHVGSGARDDRSWRSPVRAALVRAWRELLDGPR